MGAVFVSEVAVCAARGEGRDVDRGGMNESSRLYGRIGEESRLQNAAPCPPASFNAARR